MRSKPRIEFYRIDGNLNWHVDLVDSAGQSRSVDLDTANLTLAQQRFVDELLAGAQTPVANNPAPPRSQAGELVPGSVEWALAEHLHRSAPDLAEATQGAYRTQAGHMVRLLGGVPVTELRRSHVDEYVAQRATEQAGPETRRKELVLLRSSLRTARDLGAQPAEADGLLFPKLRSAYVPRDRWLTFEEYQLVHAQLPAMRQLQLVMACFTGARRAELLRIRWEHVDWTRAELTIHQSKPGKSRRKVPLPAELKAALLPLRQPSGRVLGSFNNLYREFDRACEKVAVPHFSLNDCRRTFASWMLQGGVPLYDVSKLLGHQSIAMVQKVYGHLADDSLRKAVATLPSFAGRAEGKATSASRPGPDRDAT